MCAAEALPGNGSNKHSTRRLVATGTNDAAGQIVFDPLEVLDTTRHDYVMKELPQNGDEWQMDEAELPVEVQQHEDGEVQVEYPQGQTFVNTCHRLVEAEIVAKKKFCDKNTPPQARFSFGVFDSIGLQLAYAVNQPDGNIRFTPLPYDMPGHYHLLVRELAVLDGGGTALWELDKTEYPVVVHVTEQADRSLRATVFYPNGVPVFYNRLSACTAPPQAKIVGKKLLTSGTLSCGQFCFALQTLCKETVATAWNDAEGCIAFAPLPCTKPGIFRYEMRELPAENAPFLCDTHVFLVVVHVTQWPNGALEAQVTYPQGEPVFVNQPKPICTASPCKSACNPASATVQARLFAVGGTLPNNLFCCGLWNTQQELVAQTPNDTQGAFMFNPLPFALPGEYHYSLGLCSDAPTHWSLDATTWPVCIIVCAGANGCLQAQVRYPNGAPAFISYCS